MTKNIQIDPVIGATYTVNDDKNCLRDSFIHSLLQLIQVVKTHNKF